MRALYSRVRENWRVYRHLQNSCARAVRKVITLKPYTYISNCISTFAEQTGELEMCCKLIGACASLCLCCVCGRCVCVLFIDTLGRAE